MEYLNVLQFIKQFETTEELQRVDIINEVDINNEDLYNSNFNYVNEMEV
ncbi:MAG: hypothetical protein J6T10_24845 [Methanobrevibacter sp.]|nr:hypothetical protein [Methanobrevibacter sp.]